MYIEEVFAIFVFCVREKLSLRRLLHCMKWSGPARLSR